MMQEKNAIKKDNKISTSGLFVRIPEGYRVVVERLKGELVVKEPGLRMFRPFDRKYVYYINDMPMDFSKEGYKSKDGYEVIVDTAIIYHVSIEKILLYHKEKNGEKNLKLVISELLRTYISEHTFDEISNWTFDLNQLQTGSSKCDPEFEKIVVNKIIDFREKYGISVSNIIIEKAELTDNLKNSREEDELTKAKNKRMVETAKAEYDAAKYQSDAEKLKGETQANILANQIAQIIKETGITDEIQRAKLIRDFLVKENAKYTVVESNNDELAKMATVADMLRGSVNESDEIQKVKK